MFTTIYAQQEEKLSFPLSKTSADTSSASNLENKQENIENSLEQNKNDSISANKDSPNVKISKDALPSKVITHAKDSLVLDIDSMLFYLYGDAKVSYEKITVSSGQMVFNQKSNVMTARPLFDTSGKKISHQEFTQDQEKFTFDTLQYNFKSKRALVRNAHSQYGEGFIISEQIKRNSDESIFGYRNIYTTCNLPHPHFGIRAKKIKVIPNRLIASGPANIEIMDVPTPLFLPFGVFPITEKQRSGFLLPTYTIEERRGVGLQDGGYYFSINDYLGLITQFNVFSKGSWGTNATLQYNKRYQYSGNFSVRYLYTKMGEAFDSDGSISKDFRVSWSHNVDGKARPGTSFSASVNFGTSSFNYLNGDQDINNVLNNQYSSSISYSKQWIGKPYSFTAALRHSQNTQSHLVTVTLPEMNFNLGQFSPFQRKNRIGSAKWYEKISVTYSVGAVNNWNFVDSNLKFDQIHLNDFGYAIKHNAAVSASYSLMKYFTWSMSAPYTEYWNFRQEYRNYDPNSQLTDTFIKNGFFPTRDFSFSSSLSTRIYGIKLFKKGKVMGVRHVINPSINASYQPGFAHSPFNYLYPITNQDGTINYLSPYAYTPFGGPTNPNSVGSIGFSVGNTLQMKMRPSDTTKQARKVSLIDNLSINGSYNLFADSLNMSNINVTFRTSIWEKVNVSANSSFDPYQYKGTVKINRFLFQDGGFVKLNHANISLGMSFMGKNKSPNKLDRAAENDDQVAEILRNDGYDDYYDFNIPWNLSINGGIGFNRNRRIDKPDTLIIRPNLTFNGGFNLTERWKVSFNSAVEFKSLREINLGTTNINISRDLHCWQMSLNLVPFGFYRSFNFALQVKASVLQDLKLTRRKTYYDNL